MTVSSISPEFGVEGERAEQAVESIAKDAPVDETLALLKSIQSQPSSIHTGFLIHHARHENEEVRLEVARAMRHLPDPRNIPGAPRPPSGGLSWSLPR